MEPVLVETAPETGEGAAGFANCYLRFCAEHLRQLEDCIVHQDVASVSQIAHALNENANQMGLSELSSLARQLEEYCMGRDWGAIDATFQAIADTVIGLCTAKPTAIGVVVGVKEEERKFAVHVQ